ncbi:MAG: AAA family ATPase, partial [Candidatus Lambdaproteobacteria bacterium]|nr:AAA family ATPase [Candidatus Lambdaproteobacteria bacterium]
SRTLAQALAEQRDLLCGPERERIRVSTIHGWVRGLLAEGGQAPLIAGAAETEALWAQVVAADTLGLTPAFYRAEWEHVVLPQDLRREEDYLRADRAGLPALPTGRAGRRAVWAVLSRYEQGLSARGLVDFDLLVRSARDRLAAGTLPIGDVAAVVVDEAQDLRSEELRFLAALLGGRRNGLFLVGDAHQRIFRSPFAMSRFGIAVEGRTTRLRLNYRSTGHILVRALQVVSHEPVRDLDEQVQSYAGYYSLRTGREPQLLRHSDPDREAGAISALLRGIEPELGAWNRVAVFARLDRQVRHLHARLRAAGIPALLLRDEARPSEPGVHLATMHRAKGLEYPVVILAGLDQGVLPLPHRALSHNASPSTRLAAEHLQQERNLLYVAMSRARDLLFLSCGGALSPLVAELFRQGTPARP